MLSDSGRRTLRDKIFAEDAEECSFDNHLFTRVAAKGRTFRCVTFKYTIFDTCYFRNCRFDSCDFTGCRFLNSNLSGSTFTGSDFRYAVFANTLVDSSLLDTECPAEDNLKLRFARSLRMNYSHLGDAAGANKAMSVELSASETHLSKAWRSNESYYRHKYKGIERAKAFGQWLSFKVSDLAWGNGERPLRILRGFVFFLILMTLFDVLACGRADPLKVDSYLTGFANSLGAFLGTETPTNYPKLYVAFLSITRFVTTGIFLSIILKIMNKR